MIALLAALGAAPAHAGAQIENPNAPVKSELNSQGQAALPAQPGQVKREEAEEENVYRHTPMVQKLAKAFHLDIETTARLFEWINFAIILLAIVIPIAKFLPRVMRRRSQNLKNDLETARKTTADANTRLGAVEAQLARLDDEIAKIRATVEEESRQDEARIRAAMEEESARIVASAEQEIAAAAAHAQRGLRHFAADLAIDQAANQLILTPETDRALIAEFVTDTTGNGRHGNAGGNR
ncbi:MAG TPA: ATP synthase F0 subunit B [Terracidiphilus sp.]|nr:ATP synthase F0 subunit B [Terracidiphilus sp.]